jgi:hypothetical protein
MTQQEVVSQKPASGGKKSLLSLSASTQPLEFNDYINLTRYQEYLNQEYCIACSYFQEHKGHFGNCTEMPRQKDFDGTKKQIKPCFVWRLKTKYIQNNIEQKLPDTPSLKPLRAITKRRGGINHPKYKRATKRIIELKPIHRKDVVPKNIKPARICPHCKSTFVVSKGWRHNKYRKTQHLFCKSCRKYFRLDNPFPKSKCPVEVDQFIIERYKIGESGRFVADEVFAKFGLKISCQSVIRKVRIFSPETPRVKQKPVREETKLKIRESVIRYFETQKGN